MEILKFKLPLRITFESDEYGDGYKDVYLHELELSEIHGLDKLFGQYNWLVEDYSEYTNKEMANEYREADKNFMGFNDLDIMADIKLKDAYYIIEIVAKTPLNTVVKVDGGRKEMTLKDAIIWTIQGQISDGVGENELGYITYKGKKYDVWLEDPIEIGDEY